MKRASAEQKEQQKKPGERGKIFVVAGNTHKVVDEKDTSFGNFRSRVTLEIEAPEAKTDRERLIAMMDAAIERHRKDWPDAVTARLWDSYDDNSLVRDWIEYAPDGCGWTGGTPCNAPLWDTDLFDGNIPLDLIAYGKPTEKDQEAAKDLTCRQDWQCWYDKHSSELSVYCAERIENLAKYDYDWTSWTRFPKARWEDKEEGTIRAWGDELKFQNGFSAWQRVRYFCTYNPSTRIAVVEVEAY